MANDTNDLNERPFEFVTGPRMLGYTKDGLNCLSVDENGQVTVCFNVFKLMTIPSGCRMYDAPHLICWNTDGTEVGFFARYRDQDCMCMVRRISDKADMWYLHGVPSEVILEPTVRDRNVYRITPIVRGIHAFKAPSYFDDFELVPCEIKGVPRISEPKPQEPENSVDVLLQSEALKQNHAGTNRTVIISMAAIGIIWLTATIMLAEYGYTEYSIGLGVTGGLGILYAVFGRLASRYKPEASRKTMRWCLLVFFAATFSSLTYRIAKGIYSLISIISGSKPSVGLLFVIETIILFTIPFVYRRRSLEPDNTRFSNRLAWIRMTVVALWLGCLIFSARIGKLS